MTTIVRSRRRVLVAIVAVAVILLALVIGRYALTRSPTTELLAFYPNGRATVAMDADPPVTFELVERGAFVVSPGGAGLTWRRLDDWYLNLNASFGVERGVAASPSSARPVGSSPVDSKGSLQIEVGNIRRWSSFEARTCAIVYGELTVTRIAGSVRCRGLVWYDGSSIENIKPLDVPPFDLDVDFEVTGDGTLPTPMPH